MHECTRTDSFPILLVGDFNVDGRKSREDGSDSEEYIHMMEILNNPYFTMRDLLKEHFGVHPITSGDVINIDGEEVARETVFTHPNDQFRCKSLDYIFWVERKAHVGKRAIFDFKLSIQADPFSSEKAEEVRKILSTLAKRLDRQAMERKNTMPVLEEKEYKNHPELKPEVEEALEEIQMETLKDEKELTKVEEEEEKKKDPLKKEYSVAVDLNSVSVEEMFRDGKKFTQLSDHYGVAVNLNFKVFESNKLESK